MNCSNFNEYISAYYDDLLTDEEKEAFKRHMEECNQCKIEYINFMTMMECIHEIEDVEIPKNFSEELKGKLLKAEKRPNKPFFINWKVMSGIAAGLLILIMSAAILQNTLLGGHKTQKSNEFSMEAMDEAGGYSGMGAPPFDSNGAPPGLGSLDTESYPESEKSVIQDRVNGGEEFRSREASFTRKIIQRGRIHIEVEKFDEVYEKTMNIIGTEQGFVQHSEVYYNFLNRERPEESLKSAYMELRIPNSEFLKVFSQLKDLGVVVEENISGQDITEVYIDTESQVQNLTIQEERLRDILQKADAVEDLLKIENELNRVRSQINSLTTALSQYDKLVDMSTINLQITQVTGERARIQSVKEGVWNKAKNNFILAVNEMIHLFEKGLIKLFGALPALILMAIIGVPVIYVIYKRRKKEKDYKG
jgi:hypothetical protein